MSEPASLHNAYEPRVTETIPFDAKFCRYHGFYFPTFNAGGMLVCHECMLDDGAMAVGWSPDRAAASPVPEEQP